MLKFNDQWSPWRGHSISTGCTVTLLFLLRQPEKYFAQLAAAKLHSKWINITVERVNVGAWHATASFGRSM
jgi:hypothetical protein